MVLVESGVEIEKVTGTFSQIEALYDLLKKRKYNISNVVIPGFNEHIDFVRNHPYRAWYLVRNKVGYIGSVYVMRNNCVGINLISDIDMFPAVVQLILKKHKPLKEVKSVRPPFFYINIAADNSEVEHQLIKLNAHKLQSTFILGSFTASNL